MTTAIKGIRYELKSINKVATGTPSTILTVPSTGNYFVFINYIKTNVGGGGAVTVVFDSDTVGSWSVGGNITMMDYGGPIQPYTTSDNTLEYHERLVFPGGTIDEAMSSSTDVTIYYTEVYFGGLASY